MFAIGDRIVIEGASQHRWNGLHGIVDKVLFDSVRIKPSEARPDGYDFQSFIWPKSQVVRVVTFNADEAVEALRKAIQDARQAGVIVECKITHSVPTTDTL